MSQVFTIIKQTCRLGRMCRIQNCNANNIDLHTDYNVDGQCRDTKGNGYQYIQQQTTNEDCKCHPKWTKTSLIRRSFNAKIIANEYYFNKYKTNSSRLTTVTPYPLTILMSIVFYPPNPVICLLHKT